MNQKYLFVTGGVVSSIGKGLTAASIAMLLELRGLKIALLKLDPYLNVDPGTMNPFQHGEIYVTDDGAEVDLDLGHYYRFTQANLSKASNVTSGQIYDAVIKQERRGEYAGTTVQVIPNVTDEIKKRILECAHHDENTDLVIVEIGGTVGDIESLPFLEAIRQFRHEKPTQCMNIHLTYVPRLRAAGEVKTKPTQHSVHLLRGIGIVPDMIICRCEEGLSDEIKDKISLFCSVNKNMVIDEPDVSLTIYEVPLMLNEQKIDKKICEWFNFQEVVPSLDPWREMIERIRHPKEKIVIGVVGKYIQHQDAYRSVFEALRHAAIAYQVDLEIRSFESDKILEKGEIEKNAQGCDGYLVPGGFGERGWVGKIMTAKYCREKKIPYLGLCFGMQVMCVEFARHVLHLTDANSTEIDPQTPHPVITLLDDQENVKNLGGTQRLGSYPCLLRPDSKSRAAYGTALVNERHRHRFEFNNAFKNEFEKQGCIVAGTLQNHSLCEIMEIVDHPWMVGVQFHPEFRSKPNQPHPLFKDFIKAVLKYKKASF